MKAKSAIREDALAPSVTPKPEVLAPAGSPEALQAAIRAGADSVYFGLDDYNARIRARNFTLGELPDVMADLHRWGVHGYVTFNTLVFLEEEAAARRALEAIAAAQVDAVIVQDLGVVRWIREIAPDLPVHASTQMTVSSADGVAFARRQGIRRVVLGRELSVAEIARIREASDTELEVFVHGALCVSYSGQCLSSEAWGGRSANRGQCAQACRLPYDLLVDGSVRDLGDRAHLLSPKDLEGYRRIPDLTSLGVRSFKIEGRMKSPEYVSAATRLYRNAVDAAWSVQDSTEVARKARGDADGGGGRAAGAATRRIETLAAEARQVYSRGGSEGFLAGVNHQVLVDGRIRSHRGQLVGRVAHVFVSDHAILVTPEPCASSETEALPLRAGDGLLLAISSREEDEVGGRAAAVDTDSRGALRVEFARASRVDLARVRPGTAVYRTSSVELQRSLSRRLQMAERRVRLDMTVTGRVGETLHLRVVDAGGRAGHAASQSPATLAERMPLDAKRLREQLGRLGDTSFELGTLRLELEGAVFVPVSELNRMRRDAIAELEQKRRDTRRNGRPDAAPPETRPASLSSPGTPDGAHDAEATPISWAVERAQDAPGQVPAPPPAEGPAATQRPVPAVSSTLASAGGAALGGGPAFEDQVQVLCRERVHVEGALAAGVHHVVLDFLDLVGLKDAIAQLRAHHVRITLALPRVQKPGEEKIEGYFVAREPDEILVRSLASLERLTHHAGSAGAGRTSPASAPRLIGDVSLNAVNPTTVEFLVEQGLDRLAPGLDLNGSQLEALAHRVDPARLEIPLHHHLPVFHTEHCVFAAFLSDGGDFRTCGRPCDRHRLALRDRTGQEHPVIADVGCRNTVFGARPQSAIGHLAALRSAGVRAFRLEMVSETRAQTVDTIDLYRRAWRGELPPDRVVGLLRAEGRYGVSTGAPEPARRLETKPMGGKRPAPR